MSDPRPDALHVYGIDLLSTSDILAHFNAYGASYVEWLNDSSCNVCFPDQFTVKRIIVQMGEALTDEERSEAGGASNIRVCTTNPSIPGHPCILCSAAYY